MGISAVMTSAAVNMGVQAPLYASELHSLGLPPRRVELDQLLLVLRNLRSGYTALYSCQHECGFTLEYFSHSKQNLQAQYICFPNGFCLSVIPAMITFWTSAFLMAFFVCLWSRQWLHSEIWNAEDDNIIFIVSWEAEKV